MRNVELPLKSQSVPAYECREKAEQALGTVGLGHCVEYPLDQLSAAQRQLVSIARALVNDPSVIFLDEPTRGLDSTSREELMGLLQKLNDQGRTIVMTTKDPVEARYCLSNGKAWRRKNPGKHPGFQAADSPFIKGTWCGPQES